MRNKPNPEGYRLLQLRNKGGRYMLDNQSTQKLMLMLGRPIFFFFPGHI